MPRRTIHVRKNDVEVFDAIDKRPDWLHDMIGAYKKSNLRIGAGLVQGPIRPEKIVPPLRKDESQESFDRPTHLQQQSADRKEEHYATTKATPGPNGMKEVLPTVRPNPEDYFRHPNVLVHETKDEPLHHIPATDGQHWESIDEMP